MADEWEVKAVRIVANRLGGRWEEHDTGKQQSQYDFNVFLPDGGFIALEVTQNLDGQLATLRTAMDRHSPRFSTPKLRRGWYLYLAQKQANFRRLKGQLLTKAPDLLASLESQGIVSFWHDSPLAEARSFERLGIEFGICHSYEEDGEGFVYLHEPGQSGATGPALIVQCALVEASKEDNLTKLRRAGDTNGRHLFVWVRNELPRMAFDEGLPRETPELPEPLTALWIGGRDGGVTYAWWYERGGKWEVLRAEEP